MILKITYGKIIEDGEEVDDGDDELKRATSS